MAKRPAEQRLKVFAAKDKFPFPHTLGQRVLETVAAARGVGPRQALLSFLAAIPPVFAIPKVSAEQAADNAATGDPVLTKDETARLAAAFSHGERPSAR